MKRTIQVYKTGHAFLGKNVAEDGYVGEVEALFSTVTIVLIKPNAPLDIAKRNLEIVLQELELRINEDKELSKQEQVK